MKQSLIFVVFFSLISFNAINEEKTMVKISSKSTLCVEGKTNVNEFNCNFDVSTIDSNIPVSYITKSGQIDFTNASLILNNDCFDCGHKVMNKDFKRLLKTESHPQIILTLNRLYFDNENQGLVEALVSIKLAGEKQQYKIPVHVNKQGDFNVNGQLHIKITDFNLDPPQKMLGLIKVKETITINFDFILENLTKKTEG